MNASDIRRLLSRKVPHAYVPLIATMRFFIEPEISCSRFFAEACFQPDGTRTELGEFLAQRMKGGLFVDIPCGLPSAREAGKDADLIPLVRSLGFADAWEADITAEVMRDRVPGVIDVTDGGTGYLLAEGIGEVAVRTADGMHVAAMQDDLLGFVSKLSEDHPPMTLYISALQPDAASCEDTKWQATAAVPYLTNLYDEIDRTLGANDLLILNSGAMLCEGLDLEAFPDADPAIALMQRGFSILRRDRYGKVHVYVRE